MPLKIWLIVFHPILVSLLVFIALVLLLGWTGLWARYKKRILLVLLAAYAIDAAFALPRILFAHGLSKEPVVTQRIPPPRRLVLVSVQCKAECHDWLISGAIDEIISVTPSHPPHTNVATAVRYRVGWVLPGTCPRQRESAGWALSPAQRQSGYCPLIEPVDIPTQGIFLIHEGSQVLAKEPARAYTPTYLAKAPPGPVIRFFGMELQDRTSTGTKVLASTYHYEAPGFLGLPPLLGCWDRPDNILWIMPPGDTGCGFWRWFTGGGERRVSSDDPKWVFDQAFGPPDRPLIAPKLPDLPPPTPAQALEILSKSHIEFYLPIYREALLDPSNSNEVLRDLVVRRARSGALEGALIAFLAAHRPAAIAGLVDRLKSFPAPAVFATSGSVLDEMEKNSTFRDEFAEAMFLALASNWPQENIERFVNLMETSHPGWFCERIDRFTGPTGILKMRESGIIKNLREWIPPFIRPIMEKSAHRCPDATIDLLQSLRGARDLVRPFCGLQKNEGDGRTGSAKTNEFCRK